MKLRRRLRRIRNKRRQSPDDDNSVSKTSLPDPSSSDVIEVVTTESSNLVGEKHGNDDLPLPVIVKAMPLDETNNNIESRRLIPTRLVIIPFAKCVAVMVLEGVSNTIKIVVTSHTIFLRHSLQVVFSSSSSSSPNGLNLNKDAIVPTIKEAVIRSTQFGVDYMKTSARPWLEQNSIILFKAILFVIIKIMETCFPMVTWVMWPEEEEATRRKRRRITNNNKNKNKDLVVVDSITIPTVGTDDDDDDVDDTSSSTSFSSLSHQFGPEYSDSEQDAVTGATTTTTTRAAAAASAVTAVARSSFNVIPRLFQGRNNNSNEELSYDSEEEERCVKKPLPKTFQHRPPIDESGSRWGRFLNKRQQVTSMLHNNYLAQNL